MKYIVLMLGCSYISLLVCAPRNTELVIYRDRPNVVYVPVPVNQSPEELNPLQRDQQMEQQLFGHFIAILGNFGHILLDPHDEKTVTTNVGNMINNIVSVAQTVMKKTRSDQKNFAQRLSLALIKYFQYQAYLQKQKAHGKRLHK